MTMSQGRPNADLRRGGRRGTHWNFASAFSRWDPPLRFDMLPDATDPDAAAGTLARSGVPGGRAHNPRHFSRGLLVCNFGEAGQTDEFPKNFRVAERVPLFPAQPGQAPRGGSVAMSPWSCDDIVTCDNFEYMVRPWAEALLLLAVILSGTPAAGLPLVLSSAALLLDTWKATDELTQLVDDGALQLLVRFLVLGVVGVGLVAAGILYAKYSKALGEAVDKLAAKLCAPCCAVEPVADHDWPTPATSKVAVTGEKVVL